MTSPPTVHPPRPRSRGRALVLAAVLLLGPLLLLELGVRWLVAAGHLPPAPTHIDRLDVSLAAIHRMPVQDVLIMGDSQAATGIDPTLLARLLSDAAGEPVTVYGMGVPNATATSTALLHRMLADDGKAPRVVVYVLSVAGIVMPEGADGDDDGSMDHAAGTTPTLGGSPMGSRELGCPPQAGLVERIDCELGRWSAAWQWRGRLERAAAVVAASVTGQMEAPGGILRADGLYARPVAQRLSLPRRLGVGRLRLERVFPRVEPAAVEATRRFVEAVEAGGDTIVLLAVPLTPPYRDLMLSHNPAWDADRRAATSAFAAAVGRPVTYVDAYGDWWDDRSASDLNHLSEDAAALFTQQLWAMPEFRSALQGALAEDQPGG